MKNNVHQVYKHRSCFTPDRLEREPHLMKPVGRPKGTNPAAAAVRRWVDIQLARTDGDGTWTVIIRRLAVDARCWVYDHTGRVQTIPPVSITEAVALVEEHDGWTYHVVGSEQGNAPDPEGARIVLNYEAQRGTEFDDLYRSRLHLALGRLMPRRPTDVQGVIRVQLDTENEPRQVAQDNVELAEQVCVRTRDARLTWWRANKHNMDTTREYDLSFDVPLSWTDERIDIYVRQHGVLDLEEELKNNNGD